MQITRTVFGSIIIVLLLALSSCGPKSVTTDPVLLQEESKSWIPFSGGQQITYYHDTNKVLFTSDGRLTYFEKVRYMSDQSGFFTYQKDYYADLEREELAFSSSSTDYFLQYTLSKGKGESGEWDLLHVEIADGSYYSNKMKIVVYQTDGFDKGEVYSYKNKVTLNGNVYDSVYYVTQERRPFELYYTPSRGIVAFKVSSNEIWTIDPDNMH